MGKRIDRIRHRWESMKASGSLHNLAVFVVFVAVATMFWLILALNDDSQDSFDTRLVISNIPDSVTFITDPPTQLHVSVRDRGTNLLRTGVMRHPVVNFNFRDYASGGVMRISHSDIVAALKATFGTTAQIASVSVDSLRLAYTTGKGKRVPVVVSADIVPAPGNVLAGPPSSEQKSVHVYAADRSVLDTLTRVFTDRIVRRGIEDPTDVTVPLHQVQGVRMVPDKVKVHIAVEPLIAKESLVSVTAQHVPAEESLLLFPSKVTVRYFVPMSKFSDYEPEFEIVVDYNDITRIHSNRLPVKLQRSPKGAVNAELRQDSVEYTIVRGHI
ncbi:MAG: hypothetical protein K2J24_05340 [Muribaculaceae bacterium]|nr:hypothetical protein [Muribaculaceae bacterium]